MQACACDVVGVNVADEGVCRVVGKLDLEQIVIFLADRRVRRLARLRQIFVDLLVGVAGIVCALVGAEDLVGVIVRVEGTAPADQARLLSASVHLCRNVHRAVDADLAQLLRGSLKAAFLGVLANVHFIDDAIIGPGCVSTFFTAGRQQCQREKKRGCGYSQFSILPFHLQY